MSGQDALAVAGILTVLLGCFILAMTVVDSFLQRQHKRHMERAEAERRNLVLKHRFDQ